MTQAPGPLLASGRAADVFDIGGGRVLRRVRAPDGDVETEARVMRLVAEHGYPVPEVFDAVGRDLVMSYVDGPTMLDDLQRRPWGLRRHVRCLAELHDRLARIPAPEWLMAPGTGGRGGSDRVLHLDLHPQNVLLSSDGPVVIDWANAAGGPPGFDAALSYVVMRTYVVDDTRGRVAKWAFTSQFRRRVGRRLVDAYLGAACDHRLADPHLTPDERVEVAVLRRRWRERP